MNTESFPLLRLPFCVLDIVCKKLSNREIFDLSLCSKKARRVAKQFRDKSRVLFIEASYEASIGDIEIGEGDHDNRILMIALATENPNAIEIIRSRMTRNPSLFPNFSP